MTKILSVLSAGLALLLGGIFGTMLSGFGPFAAQLSVASIGGALVAALITAWLGAVLLKTRWLASLLFSAPFVVGLLFAALSQQWGRCLAMLPCVAVSFTVVGLFTADGRKIRDPEA
jgi:hypothetical protein